MATNRIRTSIRSSADAQKEMQYGRNCLNAIHNSGDGTREHPDLVLRISDERDLMLAMGKKSASQSLVREKGKSYDVIKCTDGSTLWFDITSFFKAFSWASFVRGCQTSNTS